MREAVTRVWPLFVAIFLMMVGNGLGASLLGVRAGVEGFSGAALGVIMSMYYVGFLGGSSRTPGVLADVGHIRVFAALASVASVAVLGHILFLNEWTWGLMRLVTGFSLAGLYVTAESWLNDSTSNETRGRMLSLYMVVVMGGVATGQLALNVADIRGARLFILASAVLSLAVVPVTLASAPGPADKPVRVRRRDVFRRVPLGVVGIFGVAIAHGAMFSMGAAFAQSVGLRVRDVSLFMTAMIVGSLLATWPLGRLSDRWSRRWVIAGVSFAAAVAATAGVLAGTNARALIWTMFVLGALSFPLYSLLVAHTNDFVEHDEMVGVSSALVFFTGVGSILGPPVAGLLMANTVSGFFWFLAVVHAGVGVYAVYRIRKRERVPDEQRAVFVPVSPRAGSAAAYPEGADAVALAEAAGLQRPIPLLVYGLHPANLAFRFVLELAALVAMGIGAASYGTGAGAWLLGIGVPMVAAAGWGTFNVPDDRSRSGEAPVAVRGALRLVLELGFFAAAVLLLRSVSTPAAAVLAAAVLIHYLLSRDRIRWLLAN